MEKRCHNRGMPLRPKEKLDRDGLWNYAARLLSGRALTIGQLREKLAARAAVDADIDDVLGRLKEMRVLNDRTYADSFSAARRDGNKFGKARVLRELAVRQVPRGVAETAVREAYAGVDEVEHALEFLRRKLRIRSVEDLEDPKKLRAAYRRLRYNGFASAPAIAALKRFTAMAEELEGEPEESEG